MKTLWKKFGMHYLIKKIKAELRCLYWGKKAIKLNFRNINENNTYDYSFANE